MAVPTESPFNVTYVVYRDIQPGEPFDPTSPLLFFPPKGSDELFDALRLAFPHLKTHSERMRDAIIQFLLEERQEEQLQASPAMTVDTTDPTWLSMSSSGSASMFSSPDLLDLPTPNSFANSPQAQAPQLARQPSTAGSSQTTPPSLEQMTGVFSLSAEAQPKQRVRRKMTDAEKAEYRKRRIVKACDKCAKRKRKCPHNQAQMEEVKSTKSGTKVAKAAAPKASKSPHHHHPDRYDPSSLAQLPLDENFDFTAHPGLNNAQSFNDFPMFDDAFFPEFTVDDLVHFEQPGLNFQPHDYFAPTFAPSQHRASSARPQSDCCQTLPPLPAQHVPCGTSYAGKLGTEAIHTNHNDFSPEPTGALQQSRRSGMRVSREAETRIVVERGVSPAQGDIPGDDGQHGQYGRSGEYGSHHQNKPQPTHTWHMHNGSQGEPSALREGCSISVAAPQLLQQTILRLTGTVKALRAFARLAKSSDSLRSRKQSVSMEHAVTLLRNASEEQQHSDVEATQPRVFLPRSRTHHTRPHSAAQDLGNALQSIPGHARGRHGHREGLRDRMTSNASSLELRLQASTSVLQPSATNSGGAALPQGRRYASLASPSHATVSLRKSSGEDTNQSREPATTSRITATTAAKTAVAQPSQAALGQGIAFLEDVSSELFMLRRRIPRKRGTNQNHRHTTNDANIDKFGLAAQANGGAYMPLESTSSPAASNDNTRSHAITASPVTIVASAGVHSAHVHELARLRDTKRYRDHHGRTDLYDGASHSAIPQEDRLRDYFKVKDHRGRDFAIFPATLAMGLFMLALVFSAEFSYSAAMSCSVLFASLLISFGEQSVPQGRGNGWLPKFTTRSASATSNMRNLAQLLPDSPLRFPLLV